MSVSLMIVDDESDVPFLFEQAFEDEVEAGLYVLHFASSGEDALNQLRAGIRPELVLIMSDVNMPAMNGLELLSALRAEWPNVRVLMITAYDNAETRAASDRLGAIGLLAKPIDFDALKGRIKALMAA